MKLMMKMLLKVQSVVQKMQMMYRMNLQQICRSPEMKLRTFQLHRRNCLKPFQKVPSDPEAPDMMPLQIWLRPTFPNQ